MFVSGCLVTQPALLRLLPWSHLSSVLLIVYLPNEGGGTPPHVIDSHVLLPSHCPALGFLAEMFSEGEGGCSPLSLNGREDCGKYGSHTCLTTVIFPENGLMHVTLDN